MENNNAFTYQYSAKHSEEVARIRDRYVDREESKLEALRRLDSRVRMAGKIPALCIGVIGCLIFGVGMCFGLDVFGGADWLTLAFGGAGALTMLPAYPVYKRLSKKEKARLAPEILQLSGELMQG